MTGWLRIQRDILEHPKLHQVAQAKGCTTGDVLEWWLRLWFFAARHSPTDGDISRWIDQVEAIVNTTALQLHPDEMVEYGLVDNPDLYVYVVHDWYEYQGRHLAKLVRERQRAANNRDAARTRTDRVLVQETYAESTGSRNDNDNVTVHTPGVCTTGAQGAPVDTPTPKKASKAGVGRKPPTLEEVEAYAAKYMATKGWAGPNPAGRFVDHFTSNGWRVSGKAPMRDWKAALRNWTRNDVDSGKLRPAGQGKATGHADPGGDPWHKDDVVQHSGSGGGKPHRHWDAYYDWCTEHIQPPGQWPRLADWVQQHKGEKL
jgi:hypothetical protein